MCKTGGAHRSPCRSASTSSNNTGLPTGALHQSCINATAKSEDASTEGLKTSRPRQDLVHSQVKVPWVGAAEGRPNSAVRDQSRPTENLLRMEYILLKYTDLHTAKPATPITRTWSTSP
mmetsp:Transcript_116793/g.371721  ORF Transcript_116793/g.371721 Transcript_116793/m.371721 type:complete len:119 (-) Transcript_116793:1471-1827(-)